MHNNDVEDKAIGTKYSFIGEQYYFDLNVTNSMMK